MEQFLQAYGTWILLGLFFVVMLRMHAGGGGCGMGHGESADPAQTPRQPPIDEATTAETTTGQTKTLTASTPPNHRSGGCH